MLPALSQHPADDAVADFSGVNCLSKDGRKIKVGDSALFRAVNVPPSIGIIRKLTAGEEGNLKVGVNWLYRSADVKLATGSPIEAAPNEIFYSFQRDEISAAALLHPCKVAFLEKGIELPLGVSSFVCRRVYDTTNKCLWWLTDRVYTDDHQEEVDWLLERTKHKMQLALQAGDPSSTALTGHNSSQQPKLTSDVTQNVSLSTQGKSKKREKIDDCADPGKWERSLKSDGGDVSYLSQEHSMNPEGLANITDKDGGLLNLQCVDHLIHLMQQERNDSARKAGDVASCRIMLANVVAATEKVDCLNRFVQLGGLPVLDDWLQDAHKGKVGDAGNSKEGHANLEQLILALLHALDRLPIDLDALKTCIVGKSVNNLRSHKNMVIQKRARKLVDTWKKQVTAEMKMSGELKTAGSTSIVWSSKQSFTEHTQTHTTKGMAASEVALKRTTSTNLVANGTCPGDSVMKSGSPANGGKLQSACSNLKENSVKVHTTSTTEVPSSSVKEDKSGSPGHSQNSNQSLSSGTKKGAGLILKEAGEDSSGVCTNVGGSAMHNHRVIGDGQSASALIGAEREPVGGKSLLWTRNAVNEKVTNSTSVEKGSFNVTHAETLNNQRLIVKLPKLGRSPQDLLSTTNTGSSPSLQDGNTVIEGKSKMPVPQHSHFPEAKMVNAAKLELDCKGDDREGASSAISANCDRSGYLELRHKLEVEGGEGNKVISAGVSTPPFCNFTDACEAPGIDAEEGGIDLLASVAASESSEFEKFVPVELEENHSTLVASNGREPEKQTMQFAMADSLNLSNDKPDSIVVFLQEGADEKESSVDTSIANRILTNNCSPIECLLDRKDSMERDSDHYGMPKSHQLTEEVDRGSAMECASSPEDMSLAQDACFVPVMEVKGYEKPQGGCGVKRQKMADLDARTVDTISERFVMGEQTEAQIHDGSSPEEGSEEGRRVATVAGTLVRMSVGDVQKAVETSGMNDGNALEVAQHVAKEEKQDAELNEKPDWQHEHLSILVKNEKRKDAFVFDGKTPCISRNETDNGECAVCPNIQDGDAAAFLDDSQETVMEKTDAAEVERTAPESEEGNQALGTSGSSDRAHITLDSRLGSVADACEEGTKITFSEGNSNDSQTCVPQHTAMPSACTAHLSEETGLQKTVALPVADDGGISSVPSKVNFDLNEGIFVEDSLQDDGTLPTFCSLSSAVPHKSLCAPSSVPSGLTEPIAVVAAAVVAMKGAFVPPSSTSQCKVEPGWRGSGATSAFRPAEARHLPEQQFSAETPTADAASGINGRQPLDIDLNVADESLLEEVGIVISEPLQSSDLGMAFHNSLGSTSQATITFPSGGSTLGQFPNNCHTSPRLELDLNRMDETEECAAPLALDSGTRNNPRMMLDFDLNDRFSLEDAAGDGLSVQDLSVPSLGNSTFAALSRLRTNSEVINVASCPLSATPVPTLAVRSTTKAELPCSVAVVASATPFLKSGSVLSSCSGDLYTAGLGIPSSTAASAAFPYSGLPFGSKISFPSTSFATNSMPYLDSHVAATFCTVPSTEAVISPYPSWPYLMGMPDVSGAKSCMTWSRPSLDLNAGPDPVDADTREESIGLRQGSVVSQLPFQQVGMSERFSKRKEPEGGFDPFRQGTKQTWR
eukprot:c27946_g1_i2 orf=302-5200(-)